MILADMGFNLSFSKVNFHNIAPRVGLQFELASRDMPTFNIHRVRIPSSLFKDIIGVIQVIMKQYGEPTRHKTEEDRSRFLAPECAWLSATSSYF